MDSERLLEAKEALTAMALGALLMLMFLVLLNMLPSALLEQAKVAIAECEESLPRDQRCVVSAVVKDNESIHEQEDNIRALLGVDYE